MLDLSFFIDQMGDAMLDKEEKDLIFNIKTWYRSSDGIFSKISAKNILQLVSIIERLERECSSIK